MSKNILIIDNNTDTLLALKQIFENNGYQIFTASTDESIKFRINFLLLKDVKIHAALVSNRLLDAPGSTLVAHIKNALGIEVRGFNSPAPEQPLTDYNSILKEYRKEMKEKEFKKRTNAVRSNTVATFVQKVKFWTLKHGIKQVEE